ncbi:MAG: glycosyltransferase family 4 protein [Truepera sp.]|nr:glycosyltransferase family 4 protein [Truepera sp.]
MIESILLLRDRGVVPHVLVPRKGPLLATLDDHKIPYTVWPYYWWLGKQNEPAHWRALRYAAAVFTLFSSAFLAFRLRRYHFQLVYTNTVATPAGLLISSLLRLPHICHIREFVDIDHHLIFLFGKKPSLRLLETRSALLLANSGAVASAFNPLLERKTIQVVYQAVAVGSVPPPRRSEPADETIDFLLLGRLHPGKGQDIAIRALHTLINKGYEARLRIVGSGRPTFASYLGELVAELGLGASVSLHGAVEHPDQEYADCDVVLMCSQNEAFGRVTIEAMKFGRPVIGARSGGTVELIREGVTGWLFAPDDPADLAIVMERAIKQRSSLRVMGEVAKSWATRTFSAEQYSSQLVAAVEAALRLADRPPATDNS